MKFDYDLVIIGSSSEALYAAILAVYLKVRVALVLQSFQEILDSSEAIFRVTLHQAISWYQQEEDGTHLRTNLGEWSSPKLQGNLLQSWLENVVENLQDQHSLASLAALGVDIIEENGEFCRLPFLGFVVKQRYLRSKAYLIATGSHPQVPNIDGLQKVGYLTVLDLAKYSDLSRLPSSLSIIGANYRGIELAQSLGKLGKNITLLVEESRIFPQEDGEVSQLIQAQLEADGVKILTQSPVTQVRFIEGKKWLQAGNLAIETEEIIVNFGTEANINGLNLEGVGVKYQAQGIQVNERLETTHPKIYACGDVIGKFSFTNIAEYEAKLAIKNAVFASNLQVNYQSCPSVIFTQPNFAKVGLTEAQARQIYPDKVIIIQQFYKYIPQAQILGETTGFCKILVDKNGLILGAAIVGLQAGELIGIITLAMQNKLKIDVITNYFPPSYTSSEILRNVALEWEKESCKNRFTWKNLFLRILNLCKSFLSI